MKSRLRRLHTDGREFTWRADVRAAPGPDGRRHRCIRVRVWGAGKNGYVLQADLAVRRRPVPPAPADQSAPAADPSTQHRTAADAYPFPTADDVRALVAYGLRAGWVPDRRGGTFQVTSTADVALADFTVTDRLWAATEPPR